MRRNSVSFHSSRASAAARSEWFLWGFVVSNGSILGLQTATYSQVQHDVTGGSKLYNFLGIQSVEKCEQLKPLFNKVQECCTLFSHSAKKVEHLFRLIYQAFSTQIVYLPLKHPKSTEGHKGM